MARKVQKVGLYVSGSLHRVIHIQAHLLDTWFVLLHYRLSDQEITDNILLLLLAGHDTSSTTLTQLMSNLQDHPHVWHRLRDEQAAVVSRHGDQVSAAALKDMTYADAVIR